MEELERKKQELLKKYKQGTCTSEEKALLEYIYNFSAASAKTDAQPDDKADDERIKAEIWSKLPVHKEQQRIRHKTIRIQTLSAAAAILIFVVAGIAYFREHLTPVADAPAVTSKIVPGTSGATLTLSSGKKIKLSEATNGVLATEAGVQVLKMNDGTLVYELAETGDGLYKTNTLTTSKGETYKLRLPDGTLVWLNAASSLKYPSSFATLKQRVIELSGEAYLEVAKDKARPFIVKTNRQEIEVLGTHFNVNAYPDENLVKTTLLEGSVKVSTPEKSKFMKPGEQLVLSEKNELTITPVETWMAIAWKNDEFMFDDEGIEQVMNTIARWYNIDVIYKGPKPVERFGGSISRFDDVAEVLKMLERTGAVHFNIQGRTIFVSK